MGCNECDLAQDADRVAYYRWGIADVQIKACDKHLREIFSALNDAQDKAQLDDSGRSKGEFNPEDLCD